MTRGWPITCGGRGLAVIATFVVSIAACSPGATLGPTSAASAGPSAGATSAASPAPTLPSQTSTEWGRIWDAVPGSFPVAAGAVPATDSGEGPVSDLLAVEGVAADVAGFYRDALKAKGLLVSSDGPLEDGRVTLTASDGYDCRMQVVVRPAGSLNLVAVLYGAGCPFA